MIVETNKEAEIQALRMLVVEGKWRRVLWNRASKGKLGQNMMKEGLRRFHRFRPPISKILMIPMDIHASRWFIEYYFSDPASYASVGFEPVPFGKAVSVKPHNICRGLIV